jgi:hypothetical protein
MVIFLNLHALAKNLFNYSPTMELLVKYRIVPLTLHCMDPVMSGPKSQLIPISLQHLAWQKHSTDSADGPVY